MVFPTGFLTLYILFKEKQNRESNLILSSWVFMNIFWMLNELQGFPFWTVQLFMLTGIFSVLRTLYKK
jgi:hypothetical protein